MPVTLEKINDALGDIKKNMATKSEVVSLIDEKIAEDKETEKQQAEQLEEKTSEHESSIEQLQKANDQLVSEVKKLRRNNYAALKTESGNYNGIFASHEQAKNFGLFVLSEIGGNKKAGEILKDAGFEVRKDMEEGSSTSGGALVPTEFIPQLITVLENYGVFRRNTIEWPMSSDSAVAPKLSAGLTVYCPAEGSTPTKSDATIQTVGMNAKKWMTLTAISSELSEDSAIPVAEVVGRLIGQALAKKEDQVGFLGDGTSTYFGHTGCAGALRAVDSTIGNIKSLVVGDGNDYSELTLANFEALLGTIPDVADDGVDLKWYVHRYFYYTVMVKLALDKGGVNATEVIQSRVTRQKSYLGYPTEFSQVMPKSEANSQICALFANLRMGAYLGDRRQLSIQQSNDVYFDSDQIGIRGTERVAPAVHGVGDTSDAGPVCGLITAAS